MRATKMVYNKYNNSQPHQGNNRNYKPYYNGNGNGALHHRMNEIATKLEEREKREKEAQEKAEKEKKEQEEGQKVEAEAETRKREREEWKLAMEKSNETMATQMAKQQEEHTKIMREIMMGIPTPGYGKTSEKA